MVDQYKPYEENIPAPVQPVPPAVPPPVESFVPPPSPTIVVPGGAGGIPKWFYFLFGVTVIVFFLVTALLVFSLTQKKEVVEKEIVPTIKPSMVAVSPTLSIQATDSATAKLNNMGNSDDVAAIEADLKNTDLDVLDQSLNAF